MFAVRDVPDATEHNVADLLSLIQNNKICGVTDADRSLVLQPQQPGDVRCECRQDCRKIEATIHNSQTLLEIEDEFGEFTSYLRSHSDFEALVKDLRKRFMFLGDTGTYVFLYVVGEKVPSHEEWMKSREK